MLSNVSMSDVMRSLVPISRFNKGEASKIFEEVKETGFKIVLKNNSPACVLLTPAAYEELLEALEDYRLFIEAVKRMEKATQEDFIPADEAMRALGIEEADIIGADAEPE